MGSVESKSDAVTDTSKPAPVNLNPLLLFGDEYERNTLARSMKSFCEISNSKQVYIQYKPLVYAVLVRSTMAILRAMESLDISFADETLAKDSENYAMLSKKQRT